MKQYIFATIMVIGLGMSPMITKAQTQTRKEEKTEMKADQDKHQLDDSKYKLAKKQYKADKKERKMHKKQRKTNAQQRSVDKYKPKIKLSDLENLIVQFFPNLLTLCDFYGVAA